jgi:hypothetical protein
MAILPAPFLGKKKPVGQADACPAGSLRMTPRWRPTKLDLMNPWRDSKSAQRIFSDIAKFLENINSYE